MQSVFTDEHSPHLKGLKVRRFQKRETIGASECSIGFSKQVLDSGTICK